MVISLLYISTHTHTWMHADPETAASAYGRPGCLLSSNPSCCWGVFWVYSRAVVLQRLSHCHICVYVCVWLCLGDSGVAVRWLNVCVCGGLFKWNTAGAGVYLRKSLQWRSANSTSQTTEVEPATPPDSLNKLHNFKSCCMRRNTSTSSRNSNGKF